MDSKRWLVGDLVVTGCLSLLLSFGVRADVKYEELTRITGGAMEGVTKTLGFFGMKGLNNIQSTTYIKGDQLRRDSLDNNQLTRSELILLDREEVITVDHQKKTYSVLTFAEMRKKMEEALEKMNKEQQKQADNSPQKDPKDPDVKWEPKVSVKNTEETKVINGYNTRHVVLSFQMEGQDQKSKDKGALGAESDLWLTKDITGFEEQRNFYQKYAQKMGYAEMTKSSGMAPPAQDPRMGQAAEELRKQAEKMDGVPVLTTMSFNVSGSSSEEPQPTSPGRQAETSGSEPENQESVTKNLGKVLGGFGGFGRKKKKEEPKPAETAQSPSGSSATSASAVLMKTTTELKSYSDSPLPASLFEVPQGYKLAEK
jgi:hypothetical protein